MSESDDLKHVLATLNHQHKELLAALEKKAPKKDFWDKFSSVSTFLSGVIVALVGLYFTTLFNAQQARRDEAAKADQLRISQVDLLHKFSPELTGTEKQKKIALIGISALGNAELATKIASLDQSEGSQAALEALAESGSPSEKELAERALRNYRSYEANLANVSGGSEVGRAALRNAIDELKAGVWQGSVEGEMRIKRYLAAVDLPESTRTSRHIPWSGAFVSWCFSQAHNPPPFPPRAAWAQIQQEFEKRGWLRKEAGYMPQPGDVSFITWKQLGAVPHHGGIVFHYENGRVDEIEGNASDAAASMSVHMLVARTRSAQSDDSMDILFGHVP